MVLTYSRGLVDLRVREDRRLLVGGQDQGQKYSNEEELHCGDVWDRKLAIEILERTSESNVLHREWQGNVLRCFLKIFVKRV